jgi:predicted GIY-YIG superfamily endonuclease
MTSVPHFLYWIVVPTGRGYIGVTDDPERRFAQHRCAKTALGSAIRKYGACNCVFKILGKGPKFDMLALEEAAIKGYGTRYPAGYNDAPRPGRVEGQARFLAALQDAAPLLVAREDALDFDVIFTPAPTPDRRANGGWMEIRVNRVGLKIIQELFPEMVFDWEKLDSAAEGWWSTVINVPTVAARCNRCFGSELLRLSRLQALTDEQLASLLAEAAHREGASAGWRPSATGDVHPFFRRFQTRRDR